MATVHPSRVRLRLGLTASDVADPDVNLFIGEAAGWLSNQTGLQIDANNCTKIRRKP